LFFRPQAEGTRRANLVIDSPQLHSLATMHIYGVGMVPGTAVETQPSVGIPALGFEALVLLALMLCGIAWATLRARNR
jgi:hypothetical protein